MKKIILSVISGLLISFCVSAEQPAVPDANLPVAYEKTNKEIVGQIDKISDDAINTMVHQTPAQLLANRAVMDIILENTFGEQYKGEPKITPEKCAKIRTEAARNIRSLYQLMFLSGKSDNMLGVNSIPFDCGWRDAALWHWYTNPNLKSAQAGWIRWTYNVTFGLLPVSRRLYYEGVEAYCQAKSITFPWKE